MNVLFLTACEIDSGAGVKMGPENNIIPRKLFFLRQLKVQVIVRNNHKRGRIYIHIEPKFLLFLFKFLEYKKNIGKYTI